MPPFYSRVTSVLWNGIELGQTSNSEIDVTQMLSFDKTWKNYCETPKTKKFLIEQSKQGHLIVKLQGKELWVSSEIFENLSTWLKVKPPKIQKNEKNWRSKKFADADRTWEEFCCDPGTKALVLQLTLSGDVGISREKGEIWCCVALAKKLGYFLEFGPELSKALDDAIAKKPEKRKLDFKVIKGESTKVELKVKGQQRPVKEMKRLQEPGSPKKQEVPLRKKLSDNFLENPQEAPPHKTDLSDKNFPDLHCSCYADKIEEIWKTHMPCRKGKPLFKALCWCCRVNSITPGTCQIGYLRGDSAATENLRPICLVCKEKYPDGLIKE